MGRGVVISVFCLWATGAHANPVERACLQSGRAAGDRALCACIGTAASLALSARDQRRAAGFFSDPQAAQDTRMSDRNRDRAFWDRYLRFGEIAADMCG